MGIVILAEKPSQAKDYAEAFNKVSRKRGYYEVDDSRFFNKKAYITWCIGHLIEMVSPEHYKKEWGKWELDTLPILPEKFQFQVVSDSGRKSQFAIIKKLLDQASEIYVATDADREGENIARSVIEMAGASNIPTKRLWINSLVVSEIQKGFKNLKNGVDYLPLYKEARTRQIADWVVGMNASRLYTLLIQQNGVQGSFSVGRVQTPTLFLIYKRQKAIENFISKPFYELIGNVNVEDGSFVAKYKGKFDDKQSIADLLDKHQLTENENNGVVLEVNKESKRTSSPKLHSLSSLQTKANKLWKYSPADVLSIVQTLYEKKVLSYPRTDTEFITENEFSYLKNHLKHYKRVLGVEFETVYDKPRKRYVNNSKVQEHYAIIPTVETVELDTLNEKERNIYQEVLKTTVAMFMDDYQYEQTKIDVDINGLIFHATGNVEKNKGWKAIFPKNNDTKDQDKETKSLPNVIKGECCTVLINTKEGMTTPPKRYSQGDLIDMMILAGRDVSDETSQEILKKVEGIGTGATRSGIIETLIRQKYIEIKKNLVYVTGKGEILCQAVDGTLLSSPEMTAKWEAYLAKIGEKQGTQQAFLGNIERFILSLLDVAPKQVQSLERQIIEVSEQSFIGDCPQCENGKVQDKGKFYGCTGYRDGCRFSLPKKWSGKTIPKKDVEKLMADGKSGLIKGFKSKKGTKYDAYLVLEDGKIKMEFPRK